MLGILPQFPSGLAVQDAPDIVSRITQYISGPSCALAPCQPREAMLTWQKRYLPGRAVWAETTGRPQSQGPGSLFVLTVPAPWVTHGPDGKPLDEKPLVLTTAHTPDASRFRINWSIFVHLYPHGISCFFLESPEQRSRCWPQQGPASSNCNLSQEAPVSLARAG